VRSTRTSAQPHNPEGDVYGPFLVPSSGPIHDEFEKDAKGGNRDFIGDGQCVTACKHFSPGLEYYDTSHWVPGAPASSLTANDRGTAIATFVHGMYQNFGDQNSGRFLRPGGTPGSFTLLDQFPDQPHPPGPRTVVPDSSYGHVVANSAQYYYVILVKP
jgi:hypothetical protein